MNEDAVALWVRKAENDLKTAKDELATEDYATDAVFTRNSAPKSTSKESSSSTGKRSPALMISFFSWR